MSRKLNIAVDIDDTLTETTEYLRPFLAEYFGVSLREVRDVSYENLPEPWKKDAAAFMKAYFDRVIPDTPFKPDAAWGIDALRRRGHRIVIITARTPAAYTDPYATTKEELRRGGIACDKLICTTDKASACREERIDVLIDDHPRNCDAVAAAGIRVLNMVNPAHGDAQTAHPRVRSWAEAVEAVDKIAGETQGFAPHRTPWAYACAPFEIVPGVYYVGNKSVSSHLFDTGEGLLLLDTTYTETAYLLLESIRTLGFDPRDIHWIVHTHAHIDHFGATRMLAETFGCKTYLPAADLPFLASDEWTCCRQLGIRYEPPYDAYFEPDERIAPGDILRFGRLTVTAHAAPGHTPGTMAYAFDLPCGLRAVMHGGVGLNTLTSAYSRAHALSTAWREDYARTLDRLSALSADIVLGNHPGQTRTFEKAAAKTGGHNPFIDPGEWPRFLAECRAKFNRLLEDDPL